jgi:hypothetical protein
VIVGRPIPDISRLCNEGRASVSGGGGTSPQNPDQMDR